MRFKQYLTENAPNEKHSLTYQKLIMALDTAHITKGDSRYQFNLGAVVKDSSLNGLSVRIREADALSVKLGRLADGSYVIVVSVDELPDRMEIDTLFSSNKSLMNKFIKCVSEYENKYKVASGGDNSLTRHEKIEQYYDKGNVEKSYDELIEEIESKLKEFTDAKRDLEAEMETTVNASRKNTLNIAIQKLKDEYIGSSESEFIKKTKSLKSAEFLSHLEKDVLKKILKRLESYYEQNIK